MRGRTIVRTPAAEDDLIEIWCAIAVDSPKAADRLLDAIVDRVTGLSGFPEMGPLRPYIAPEVRVLTIESYLIMYRLSDDVVEIVRVVHGMRDVTALL